VSLLSIPSSWAGAEQSSNFLDNLPDLGRGQ
jgi:hypothetical protein